MDEGYRMICGYLSQADGTVLTELAVDYVRAFIGSGNDGFSAAYPYESVYTSPKRLMMQDARDEVLVLYRAFGLDKQESWKEGEDHIALPVFAGKRMDISVSYSSWSTSTRNRRERNW